MLVKMLVGRAGPTIVYDAGREYEIADARAARLIDRGHAVAVGEPIELAVERPAPETATKYRRRKK